jgi:DnaJ like chaperone protein
LGFIGKFLGGMAGFAMGGPLGAMLGAAMGHAADSGVLPNPFAGAARALPGGADLAALLGNRETLFAISVVVLSAKLARIDGPVKRAEIDAFKRCFRIPPENMREVGHLFDRARQSAEEPAPYAERLGHAFADNKGMLEDLLAALFAIARADAPLNMAELGFLQAVHARLGLDEAAWMRARDGTGPRGAAAARDTADAMAGAYATLGVPQGASDEAVRAAWRQLMRENHPDSLAARGVPQDFVQRATAKVADINAAWDRVKRARGL